MATSTCTPSSASPMGTRISAIRVVVHLDTDADEATVAELHRKVAATSPVGQTLSKAIPIEITHQ